jgi:hypothetical protein
MRPAGAHQPGGLRRLSRQAEIDQGFPVDRLYDWPGFIGSFPDIGSLYGRVIRQGIFVPAARLSQAACALQENRFSPDMLASLARSPDEIGQLGRAFVQLAARSRSRGSCRPGPDR